MPLVPQALGATSCLICLAPLSTLPILRILENENINGEDHLIG